MAVAEAKIIKGIGDRFECQTAIVIGASIGRASAVCSIREGAIVVAIDVIEDRLAALEQTDVFHHYS